MLAASGNGKLDRRRHDAIGKERKVFDQLLDDLDLVGPGGLRAVKAFDEERFAKVTDSRATRSVIDYPGWVGQRRASGCECASRLGSVYRWGGIGPITSK